MAENEHNLGPASLPDARKRRSIGTIAAVTFLAAVAFCAWQWYATRENLRVLQHEVALRSAEIDARYRETRVLAEQSRDALRDFQARLAQTEARLTDAQNQRLAVESLYQDLARSRDEWTLAEVEQAMLIASQQLQLAGNVKTALMALETADSRLARMDRPQFGALRRAVTSDIERLRGLPQVDVTGMSLKLEIAAERIVTLPLVAERQPVLAAATQAASENAGFLKTTWRNFLQDLRSLVNVKRLDTEVVLLAPEQVYFLRENLKIRLLGARLALIAKDERTFKSDLKAASAWVTKYFMAADPAVTSLLTLLRELQETPLEIRLPEISSGLEAMSALKRVRERTLR
ncbi:MAG: uroporphyrinogen-III C-methyltransferase [Burkholderiales bacterium]